MLAVGPARPLRALSLLALPLLAAAGCAEWLLLYPTTDRIATSARRQLIAHQDGALEVWITHRRCSCPVEHAASCRRRLYLLELTGNGGRAEVASPHEPTWWGCRALEIWRVNYPGFGGSSGPARLAAIPAAALAAHDALARRARRDPGPIVVYGNSLGTTAALYIASQRRVTGLVLQNPPPLRELILRRYGWWGLWIGALPIALQVPLELDALRTAPRARAPALFLTAGRDRLVPPPYQTAVFDRYGGPRRRLWLPFDHHNAPLNGSRALRRALGWLLAQRSGQRCTAGR